LEDIIKSAVYRSEACMVLKHKTELNAHARSILGTASSWHNFTMFIDEAPQLPKWVGCAPT